MHKVNSLRQRRIEKGLPKSEQTYRGAIKNFAVAETVAEEPVVEKPKAKKKAKKSKKSSK